MKNNKAVGTDEIPVELIKRIGDFAIERLTKMLNDIYESGNIPAYLSRPIFIALPKKKQLRQSVSSTGQLAS